MVKTRAIAEKESQFEKLFALIEKLSGQMNQNKEKMKQNQEKFKEEMIQKQDDFLNVISKTLDRMVKEMDKNEKVTVEGKLDSSKSKLDVPVIAKPAIEVVTSNGRTSEKDGTYQVTIVAEASGRDCITNAHQQDWVRRELLLPCELLFGFIEDKPSSPEGYVYKTQAQLKLLIPGNETTQPQRKLRPG